MSIYGYCRVSTADQAQNGESLDVQKKKIRGYAMMQNMEIRSGNIFVERGVSGSKPLAKRPKGKQMLRVLVPGDKVIAPKLDRIFRNANDALNTSQDFKDNNIELHLLDLGGDINNTVSGKLIFTVFAAFSEFESGRIAERITEVKANQREKGRYLGGKVPFGYRVNKDGNLHEHAGELEAIQYMKKLKRKKNGYLSISKAVYKKYGYKLSHMGVKKILMREDDKPRQVRVKVIRKSE